MHSTLLKTALSVIAGYNAWNIDAIMAPRSENCTHRVYPDRLGRPTLNRTAYITYFSSLLPFFDNFTVTVTGTYVDEERNQVAVQAFSKADSVLGPYGNEYVVMMKMTEDQEKVYEVREFVDSEASAMFFPNLTAYIAAGGKGIHEL
jgi:ketosteroid isomerase-like protein